MCVTTGTKERDIHLNVLVLGCQFIHSLGLDRFPRLRDSLPSSPCIFGDPRLEILCLVFSEQRTFPPHDRVVEEHPDVAVLFLDHEWSQLVNNFLFFTAVP